MKPTRITVPLLLAIAVAGCQNDKSDIPPAPSLVPKYPRAVPTPIDPALQAAAKSEIKAALNSNDELVRAHALETLAEQHMTEWNQAIVDALSDRSSITRKAAALAAGQLQVTAAADRLPDLLDSPPSPDPKGSVHARQERVAAIFALHRLGNTQYSHELEKLSVDPSAGVRGDTAFVFGLIGDKSAIPWLRETLHKDLDVNVRLQAAESLWRLGDEQGSDALITATISDYASDQMVAALALAQPRDTRVLGNIHGLMRSDYLEVRLVCARASGMLGNDVGYGVALEGAKSVDPRHRALAALAFGSIGRADAQPTLATLLKDKDADVRLATAGALIEIGQKP